MKTYLKNAKIYGDDSSVSNAMVIEGNTIIFVGNDKEAQYYVDQKTAIIDCQNNLVLPGFNDSHLHLLKTAQFLHIVNLSQCTSKKEIIHTTNQYLENHPNHEGLLIGYGWNQNSFVDDPTMIDRIFLDDISTTFPIVFYRACNHVVAINSYALDQLQLSEQTMALNTVGKNSQGNCNGLLYEEAILYVDQLKEPLTLEKAKKHIKNISTVANQLGITSVSTNDIRIGESDAPIIQQAYQQIANENPTLRIYHQVCFDTVSSFRSSIETGLFTDQNEFNRFGSLKLFSDGSLGARTALLSQPYHDDPSTSGIAIYSQSQLDEFIETANTLKVQVVVHAIGDQALNMVLESYRKYNEVTNPLRHGIIHVQIAREEQLDEMAKYQILAYVQPIFLHADLHVVNQRVSPELAKFSYAFQSMDEKQMNVCYSSDAPIEPMNVFNNLHCAINRQDLNFYPENGYQPHQKVSIVNAINHATIDGAYSTFSEDRLGALKAGYLADVVVVDQDLYAINPSKLMNTNVLCTLFNGKIVYMHPSFNQKEAT